MNTEETLQINDKGKFKSDFIAGLVVFLVALPLCLGIAVASGVPPAAGLLAGIIGGLIIGPLSASSTSVSGPAAGLVAIVLAQVAALGGFDKFIVAVFLGGIIQLAMGLAKAGSLSAFFPASVIRGLLAAIGVILILKQIPHFFGNDADAEGEMSFFQPDKENTFSEIIHTFFDSGIMHLGATIVGILSILVLVYWKRIEVLNKSSFPAALAVVILGVLLQFGFQSGGFGENWQIKADHKVSVPTVSSMADLFGDWQESDSQSTADSTPEPTTAQGDAEVSESTKADADVDSKKNTESKAWLTKPDFSVLSGWQVYVAALTIALVASLETLLNLEAVDKLDPKKRPSPPNRELLAQGAGNCVAGLVGALPVTSVIIRSSVNIHSGVETKRSAIIHGIFLVTSVFLFAGLMKQIPLSCLAAILIMTGLKLANPKLFVSMWKQGYRQFLPFIVTLLAIVFTDLLIGVLIGLCVGLAFILATNAQNALRPKEGTTLKDDVVHLELFQHVSFLSRFSLKKTLETLEPGSTVVIDGTRNEFIDPDTLEMIDDFVSRIGPDNKINASVQGLDMTPLELGGGGH